MARRRGSSAARCAICCSGAARRFRPRHHGDAGDRDVEGEGGRDRLCADRARAWHGHADCRRPADRDDDAAGGTSRPTGGAQRCASAAISPPTRAAATSPSTGCRSTRTAMCTTTSAASPISRRRRVRFIGEARARIREDFLRILRFLRFSARVRRRRARRLPALRLRSPNGRAWRRFRPSGCGRNC